MIEPASNSTKRLSLLTSVSEFLFLEAELIDDGRFDEWLELLADDLDNRGFGFLRELVHRLGPEGDGNHDQQDAFNNCDGALDVVRGMSLHSDIIGFGIA